MFPSYPMHNLDHDNRYKLLEVCVSDKLYVDNTVKFMHVTWYPIYESDV